MPMQGGSSGSQSSKGKKGKKGADSGVPAGASSVSSGVKLENVNFLSNSSAVTTTRLACTVHSAYNKLNIYSYVTCVTFGEGTFVHQPFFVLSTVYKHCLNTLPTTCLLDYLLSVSVLPN